MNRNDVRDFFIIPDAEPNQDGIIECPYIILADAAIYPGIITPIIIEDSETADVIETAHDNNQTIIALTPRDSSVIFSELSDIYPVAIEIAVGELLQTPNGQDSVLMQGRRRVEILSFVPDTSPPTIRAKVHIDSSDDVENLDTATMTILSLFRRIGELNPNIPADILEYITDIDDPGWLADLIASTLALTVEERLHILQLTNLEERLIELTSLLREELNTLELRGEINNQVQQEIDHAHRENFLREQIRVIQGELGEGDIFQEEINEIHQQIVEARLPKEINERAQRELSRLAMMPPMSPEVGIIRTYINWLVTLPWHQKSDDNLDLEHAQKILDIDHYGLPRVKERILEYIAVRKLAADKMRSPVLCFVGPPGVGKTSLGKSIAKALGREFVRLSLGGVRDEAEIRGHRRTYIGALPGRIVQTMKRAGTINPVFMMDEIDKLGMDFRGDPTAALLEVLDPEQNNEFSDHYLEVPYDLSQVLFITTANDTYPLSAALLDRMEVIEFSGYTEEEKIAIARKHLIPKQFDEHGITNIKVGFDTRALQSIIREYTYEAGVRNLNREIGKVCRKLARRVAEGQPYPKRITRAKLSEWLGPPEYIEQRVHTEDLIGVATGLAWTSGGGDTLTIEASLFPGKGSLILTGQLGDVMQESAQAALSYMRTRAEDFNVPHDDFENYDIHIHIPEGAIPKDGPSAGITLAIAIMSAFTERKVRSDFAMTGEITLRGNILPVGGIKEKMLAARRAGIKHVILPAQNKKDLVDIPAEVLKDMNIVFVTKMDQVVKKVLIKPSSNTRKRNRRTKEGNQNSREQETS